MPTIKPRLDPAESAQRDWQGKYVAQKQWFVDIVDAAAALDFAKTNAGIEVNMPFPGIPGLIADVVQVSSSNGVLSEITALFSSDRRFGNSQKIDKDKPGYYSFNMATRSIVMKTPVNVFAPITINAGGDQSTTKMWVIENHDVEEPRVFIEVTSTATDWNKSKTAACIAQVNRIHTIGGVEYLYRGCNTNQRIQSGTDSKGGTWDVTHEWIGDPGTQPIESPTPSKILFGDLTGRPPHWKYVVIPSDDPKTTPHYVTVYKPYKSDPNGWIGLPGMPAL